MKPLSICISPLDWGLGHATRCIPIIQALQALGHNVFIAAEGHHAIILKEACPASTFLPLRGYRVNYTKSKYLFFVNILFQGPKILYSAIHEYWWLKKIQNKFHFDLIIADNRVGFFHKKVPSVFITHQLNLIMPFRWATSLFQKMQYAWIKNFTACWVPDIDDNLNLSGILANPTNKPSTPIWYMGYLSRLAAYATSDTTPVKNKIDFLAIISGPEPQRSLLENIIWKEGNEFKRPFLIVAGLPKNTEHRHHSKTGAIVHHLEGASLAEQIKSATYIICRGGYTSLMELIPFKKKLILIPTPGQTEQEYLGTYWMQHHWATTYDQASFNLAAALQTADSFQFKAPPFKPFTTESLKAALKQLNL